MRRSFRVMSVSVSAMAIIVGAIGCSSVSGNKKVAGAKKMDGKQLTFGNKKGNCLACHIIPGGEQAGNIGPPLIAMKARFPDRAVLRAQIADPRTKNRDSIMPPFETHGILTSEEIDSITDFIHTL